jgi:hypothetical protein
VQLPIIRRDRLGVVEPGCTGTLDDQTTLGVARADPAGFISGPPPRIADSLAGRMETIRMLPLARAEIEGVPPSFLEDLFAAAPHRGQAAKLHFRDHRQNEADVALERGDGAVAGIEVGASATAGRRLAPIPLSCPWA